MNMLEYDTDEQKTFVINEMIAIFDKLYDLKATGELDLTHFAQGRVRLLGRRRVHTGTHATALRASLQGRDLAFFHRRLTRLADQLVNGWHVKNSEKLR